MAVVIGDQHHRLSSVSVRRDRNERIGHARFHPGIRQLGQAMVEFALVLPIFLLLTLMLIDVGRATQAHAAVAAGAREGARAGSIAAARGDAAAMIQTLAVNAAQSAAAPLSIPSSSISVLQSPSHITVSVTDTIAPVTPLVGHIVGGVISLVGTASLPVQ
ncbi:MAG: TadE family protein [Chloroflexota bacterium]